MPAERATEWLLRHPSRSAALRTLRVLRGGAAAGPAAGAV